MSTTPDDPRDAEQARRELITDGEVQQLAHALAPYTILQRDALSQACHQEGWSQDGFATALRKATDAGVIEELPGGFYKLVRR